VFKTAFDGPDPLLRHVRTQVRSPHTNGVIQRWLSTLKYEHLFRGVITDGDALDMQVDRFRIIYNTIRTRPSAIENPARPTQVVTSSNRSMSGRSGRSEAWRFSARYHPRGRPRPWQPACR
jgi:putative transposase